MTSTPPDFLSRLASTHAIDPTNIGKLLLWNNMVSGAVAILREVEAGLGQPSVMAQLTCKDGWWRKAQRKNHLGQKVRVPEEDAITDAIVSQIQDTREFAKPGSALHKHNNLHFFSQQKRKKQKGIGPKGKKNTDITVYDPERLSLDLRIETKIVFSESDLSKEYCSEKGILRFADIESPYTTTIVGGMISYCVSRSTSHWENRIESDLSGVVGVTYVMRALIDGEYQPSVCCDVLRQDQKLPRVTVFHLALEFQTDPISKP